jgi:methylmalonyl-CoA mutase N-terminal domain/subunit
MATIARFDGDGRYGMLRAIERGYVQREIQNAAYAYQRAVEDKEAIVVGVNEFASQQEVAVPIQRIDEALEERQVERVRALRVRRDAGIHAAALRNVEDAARGGANLMPHILYAVESYATVGEIANVMRTVFGEYRETVTV